MNNFDNTQSKVNIYLYCLKHKSTPAGGLSFEKLVFAKDIDYSKEYIIHLDKLLKQIHDQNLYAKEENQRHKENFLIMLACYLGEYCKQQLEHKHKSIYWVDTLNILSNSNKTLDSNDSLWFTSLAFHVDDQVLLPLMMIRQYLESVSSSIISSQITEWIADVNSRALSCELSKTSTSQIFTQNSSARQIKKDNSSSDELFIDTSQATSDLDDLKTTIEKQKSQLISEKKTIPKNSLFAKLFTNPFGKKASQSPVPITNHNKKEVQLHKQHSNNIQIQQHIAKEQLTPKRTIKTEDLTTEATQTKQHNTKRTNDINVSVENTKSDTENSQIQVKNNNTKTSHPIVEQLEIDKSVTNYLPDNEEFIKVIDYNSDPMKELLTEKIKEKNTSAMVSLAYFKLEEFFIKNPLNEEKKLSIKNLQPAEKQTLVSIMKLIETAANKDNAAALFFLCSCYEQDFIYDADKTKYNLLLKRSAANGHRRAIKQMSVLLKNDFQTTMDSQTNQKLNDDMILWVVGGLAFAIGFFIFF